MRILHKNFCLLMLLLIGCPLSILAQDKMVTGTVRDAIDVVIGASVTMKGNTSVGTITDIDGNFTLSVPTSAKELEISFIGYDNQTIAIGNKTHFDVTLKESSVMLEEVVAIGYAKVKRKDLTGATSSVSSGELAAVPAMTAAQALQGKAAGVNIVTKSGAPGAGANITVRGGTSITQSTEPLYIVDGFEMSDALSNIDVADIESIDILKDASSTAIYGARGSNGIVLITTKSGKKGKTQVNYNTFFSFDVLSKKLDVMSNAEDFVKYQYEMAVLQGGTTNFSTVFDNVASDASDFYTGAYARMSDRYAGAQTLDWQDEVFGSSALTQNHNVNVSTGTDKTQVMLSYNYSGQDGLLANHGVNKSSFRAKVNSELWKGVRLDVNTMFSYKKTLGGGAYSGMKSVLLQPIIGGTKYTLDELLNTQTYPDLSGLDTSYDTANPIIANNATTSQKRSRLYTINAGVELDLLKNLTWRTAGSYTWSNSKDTSFADENSTAYIMDAANTGINGTINNGESFKWQITNTLNYNQTFANKHKLGVLLGHEVTYSESEGNKLSLVKFPYPNFGLDNIDQATVKDKSVSHSRNGIVSAFARVNYTFDERYLLTATVRGDGSSKFAKGNKWGIFPSVSGAWRISEENFWKENALSNTVNNLKLRVGYGTTGNCNISDYMYTTSFKQTDYPLNNTEGNLAYALDETLGNRDLKWETMHSTNIGLDFALFNSRVNVSAEWYNNQVNDLLLKSVIPSTTGYKNQFQNVGKIRNRGWEISINTVNVQTKNFRWTSDLNLAFNKSKVISLEDGLDTKTFSVGGNRSGQVNYYAVVGQGLGEMYGYIYDGIYTTDDFVQGADGKLTLKEGVVRPNSGTPQPGDIKFAADGVDKNGNPQFTQQKVKIGNGTPDCIGGFNNTFQYKGFDLSVFMKFSIGNDVYNATKHSMSPYAAFQNVPTEFGDHYYRLIDPITGQKATSLEVIKSLNPNENARNWSLNKTNSSYITYPSSYYVEDGSYLRIAQVTLGYTLPKVWLKKYFISSARLYFTANNLATLTGYSGYDPEVSAGSDQVVCTPGYDNSTYPRSRSYVVGLNLTF